MIVNKDYVVNIESVNELLRIVQSNFTFDSAQSTFSFRFDSISDQIIQRYFQRRPLIDLDVCFIYLWSAIEYIFKNFIEDFELLN